jgi:hypothetical protein
VPSTQISVISAMIATAKTVTAALESAAASQPTSTNV